MSSSAHPGSSSAEAHSGPPRKRLILPATVGILLLAAFLLTGWYLTSAGFQ